MNAKDLMVYDWVDANIDGEYRHTQLRYTGDIMQLEQYEIRPIPLTNEIMNASGFSLKEVDLYMGHHWCAGVIWTHEMMDETQEVNFNSSFSVLLPQGNIQITYVHELQHALRLVGLGNLADKVTVE